MTLLPNRGLALSGLPRASCCVWVLDFVQQRLTFGSDGAWGQAASCPLPQSLEGKCLGKGKWGKKKGKMSWALCLEAFIFFLAGGNLRERSQGGFQEINHQFSRCALSESWSPLIGQ